MSSSLPPVTVRIDRLTSPDKGQTSPWWAYAVDAANRDGDILELDDPRYLDGWALVLSFQDEWTGQMFTPVARIHIRPEQFLEMATVVLEEIKAGKRLTGERHLAMARLAGELGEIIEALG